MPFIFSNIVGYLVTCSDVFENIFLKHNILSYDIIVVAPTKATGQYILIRFVDQKNHHLLRLETISVIKLTAYISFMLNIPFIAYDVFMLFMLFVLNFK